MPKKGHTEEQIVAVVGISEATYYAWKKDYAGLGVSELRDLRQLRDENGRLVADLSLDRQKCGAGQKVPFNILGSPVLRD
jgi:putative transposase